MRPDILSQVVFVDEVEAPHVVERRQTRELSGPLRVIPRQLSVRLVTAQTMAYLDAS